MNAEDYRAHPSLNFSLAKHLLDSPAHFQAAKDDEFEPSEAMTLGTLLHALVLEGKDLRDEYALKPEGMSFVTKEGKAWRDAQTKPILADEKAQLIPLCAESLAHDPVVSFALKTLPNREMPVIFDFAGMQCKALLDMCSVPEPALILDVKTTVDCGNRAFQRKIADYHYDLQAAWYCAAYASIFGLSEPPAFYWLAVELKKPFARKIFRADESIMQSGMRKMERVIDVFKQCTESGKWELPKTEIEEISMPPWANAQ